MARVTLMSTAQQLTEVAETMSKARAQLAEHPLAELWAAMLEQMEAEMRHEAHKEAELAKEVEDGDAKAE